MKPDIKDLVTEFQELIDGPGDDLARRQLNYNTRYCVWAGQSPDLKKWKKNMPAGQEVVPWEGATDSRVYLVDHASLTVVGAFRGYTATYFGDPAGDLRRALRYPGENMSVSMYIDSRAYLDRYYGTRFQETDLWELGVPTFEEYGQWVTRQVYTWADAGRFYPYSEYGDFYKAYSDRDFPTHWGYRRERVPSLTSRIFAWDREHLDGRDPLRGLAMYKPKAALSTPERTAFERFQDPHERRAERLFLSNRDQTLVRYEQLTDGVVLRYVEVAPQLDRALPAAELAHQAPWSTRFSLSNNQPVFLGGLFALTTLLSGGVWAWLFARASDPQSVLHGRRKLWRFQRWALGGSVILLALLAVGTLVTPGRGHPPAIIAVFVLAFWCALGFGLLACFTLASSPVQWFFRARQAH